MNSFFLGLLDASKKGRRESIIDEFLPNENQDCIVINDSNLEDDDFEVWKNGYFKFSYCTKIFFFH